jgi:hypothetical protein
MITRASVFRIGVGTVSRPLRAVRVIAMPGAGLDTTRCVEVPPGCGLLRVLHSGIVVGAFIDCRCVAARLKVMH